MTKSIFEYKDDQDWYLASFGSYNHLTCFGDDEAYEQYVDFFQGLTNTLDVSGFQLHVVKHSSDLRLVSFILDCLKEELGRDLVVTQHQGTLLVSEGISFSMSTYLEKVSPWMISLVLIINQTLVMFY